MISPHTAPGTKVAYIGQPNEQETMARIHGCFVPEDGAVFIVDNIYPTPSLSGYGAELRGVDQNGFDLSVLRYVELPESLTSLLDVKPVKENV